MGACQGDPHLWPHSMIHVPGHDQLLARGGLCGGGNHIEITNGMKLRGCTVGICTLLRTSSESRGVVVNCGCCLFSTHLHGASSPQAALQNLGHQAGGSFHLPCLLLTGMWKHVLPLRVKKMKNCTWEYFICNGLPIFSIKRPHHVSGMPCLMPQA